MSMFLLVGAAFAAADKSLDVKFEIAGEQVIIEETIALPAEPRQVELDVGGVPYRVDLIFTPRHDTVVIEAVVSELKGKKRKPKEVVHPKLISYEGFPGHIEQSSDLPRGYQGGAVGELTWSLDAVWYGDTVVRPGAEAPTPPVAPTEAAPPPTEAPEPVLPAEE